MTLSRTARFLILFLLLAAAAFVWINFFLQDRTDPLGPLVTDPQTVPAAAQQDGAAAPVEGAATQAPTIAGTTTQAPTVDGTTTQAPTVTGDAVPAPVPTDATGEATTEPGDAGTVATGTEGTTVVSPSVQTAVERNLVVAELPFLITEPPAAAAADGGEEAGAEVVRPQTRRASINPFSPVLVQAPPAPPAPAVAIAPPTTEPEVEVVAVDVPGAPAAPLVPREPVVQSVVAPTPRPLAPPSPVAQNLPRQLPGGTLPVAPDILQSARVIPQATTETATGTEPVETPPTEPEVALPAADEVAAAAAIREPTDTVAAEFTTVGAATETAEDDVPGLLGPGVMAAAEAAAAEAAAAEAAAAEAAAAEAAAAEAAAAEAAAAEAAADGRTPIRGGDGPLAAGTNQLSRYLRDNNFVFTGSVLGPVSVGVFTSSLYSTPIVVALGQTLPDTDIVLTDIAGQQAEFTLDETTQALILDLRR